MALTDEQLDLILDDEELDRYSTEYHEYRITYKEFRAKRDGVYKRLGIDIGEHSHDHKERLARLEELLADDYISKDMYDKKFKRIQQDIKDESMEKQLLEMMAQLMGRMEEMDKRFDKIDATLERIEQRQIVAEHQTNDEVLPLLHSIDTKLGGSKLRLIKGRES